MYKFWTVDINENIMLLIVLWVIQSHISHIWLDLSKFTIYSFINILYYDTKLASVSSPYLAYHLKLNIWFSWESCPLSGCFVLFVFVCCGFWSLSSRKRKAADHYTAVHLKGNSIVLEVTLIEQNIKVITLWESRYCIENGED